MPNKRQSIFSIRDKRASSYHCLDDSSDGIPLVELTLTTTPPYEKPALRPSSSSSSSSASGFPPRRAFKYVSHGIGGAGNFRQVLTNLRSDVAMTDPTNARNTKVRRGVCSCARCYV